MTGAAEMLAEGSQWQGWGRSSGRLQGNAAEEKAGTGVACVAFAAAAFAGAVSVAAAAAFAAD